MLRPLTYMCVLLALTGVKGQTNSSAEICSVIGPAVIDFQGNDGSVSDLCAYSLVSDQSNGFEVVASFRERYDPEVGFLDSLTLRLKNAGVEIRLEQGGVVLVNNTAVNITSSVQTFFGVDLSDDDIGVTAVFSTPTQSFSVLFDGDTGLISMNAAGSSLTGLCVDSSKISSVRLLQYSSSSCEPQDTPVRRKRSVSDKTVIQSCNTIGSASQHGFYDPEPYKSACNKLTGYAEFNHFWCQFTWAYGRACNQRHPGVFGDWRKQTKCTCMRPVCKWDMCNYDEYCGWRADGQPGCLCRGRFAAKYRYSSNSLGEQAVCKHNTATVTLVGCLLEEKCIDYTTLHLNDESCIGTRDRRSHLVTFDFSTKNTCGADVKTTGNKIRYTNNIVNQNITGAITRQDHVDIEFSCYYPDPERKTVHFKIKDNTIAPTPIHMIEYVDLSGPNSIMQLHQHGLEQIDCFHGD